MEEIGDIFMETIVSTYLVKQQVVDYPAGKNRCIIRNRVAIPCLLKFIFLYSGNGECLSLNELAPLSYGSDGNLLNLEYSTPWDAQ